MDVFSQTLRNIMDQIRALRFDTVFLLSSQ